MSSQTPDDPTIKELQAKVREADARGIFQDVGHTRPHGLKRIFGYLSD